MTRDEMKQLNAALRELAMMYPKSEIGPETIAVYVKHLSDLPLDAALDAIAQAGHQQTFFPAVAEIRKYAGERANDADATAEDSWTHVASEIQRCGYNRPRIFHRGEWIDPPKPEFRTETERAAVESLGWAFLCTGETSEVRKQYIFTFRTLRDRDVRRVQRGDGHDMLRLSDGSTPFIPVLSQKVSG